jgi:flagellar motor switch protein FliN
MADDGVLSQADIDALLSGGLVGTSESNASSHFSPDSIRAAVELFTDQMGIVIGTLVNRSVTATVGEIWSGDSEAATSEMPDGSLALVAGFEQGFSGELALVASLDLVAALSEAMVGGDINSGFKDEHLDAFKELGNQILGAVSTALGQHYEVSLSATQGRISPFNPSSPPFSLHGASAIEIKLALNDKNHGLLRLFLAQPLVMAFTEHTDENSQSSLSPSQMPSSSSGGSSSNFGSSSRQQQNEEHENVARSHSFDKSLAMASQSFSPNVDLLLDIPLNVTIELGRSRLSIRKILELGPGSIVELDRLAGEPVDLLVNDKVVARGEVVVVDEYFGIRVLSLISPEERIKQLR